MSLEHLLLSRYPSQASLNMPKVDSPSVHITGAKRQAPQLDRMGRGFGFRIWFWVSSFETLTRVSGSSFGFRSQGFMV